MMNLLHEQADTTSELASIVPQRETPDTSISQEKERAALKRGSMLRELPAYAL